MSVPVAVFASGSGTNLQSLLDHEESSSAYRIEIVVSDRADAGALARADDAGRSTEVVPVSDRSPEAVADETLALLEAVGVRAVFLAGYLRLVPPAVVRAYRRRMVNIHPALLPSFGGKGMYGLRVHRAVLEAGCRVTGVTIHFVDEEYDEGTVLAQWPVPVRPDDTPESLAARVLQVEHVLYPRAADHLCRALDDGREPGAFEPEPEVFGLVDDPPEGLPARQMEEAFR